MKPVCVLAGRLNRDYILPPEGRPLIDVPGGDPLYAASGLAVWEGIPALLARVGEEYPHAWLEALARRGWDTRGVRILPEPLDLRRFLAYPDPHTPQTTNPVSHFARLGLTFPKSLLGYHIPGMTGVGFSLDLLARLKDAFPTQFAGVKDSSHDEAFAVELGKRFGRDLLVLNGTDSYLHHALKNHAQGAITAPANLISDGLREVWDLYQQGKDPAEAQAQVTEQRHILEKYAPFPIVLKALLPRLFDLPRWSVKPPLEEIDEEKAEQAWKEFSETV